MIALLTIDKLIQ